MVNEINIPEIKYENNKPDPIRHRQRFRDSVSLSPVSSVVESFKSSPKRFFDTIHKNMQKFYDLKQ